MFQSFCGSIDIYEHWDRTVLDKGLPPNYDKSLYEQMVTKINVSLGHSYVSLCNAEDGMFMEKQVTTSLLVPSRHMSQVVRNNGIDYIG